MRIASLLALLAALPLLGGCEQNPLENWAYQRTAASAPEQDNPPPRMMPAASRTVDTGPLRTLTPQ